MGGVSGGALNTSGFENSLQNHIFPKPNHITHAGTFNEQFFSVGPKADKLLDLYYGVGVSNCNLHGLDDRNYFVSLFLKSNLDGVARTKNINACIALDISGSMGSKLDQSSLENKTRLDLAKEAIYLFFEKLQPNDRFSLVVFHNTARTVIENSLVSEMKKEKVHSAIYQKFESGGTTIKTGFDESLKQIQKIKTNTNYENRIIVLTDVCDNSVENENKWVAEVAENCHVGTTIIGVSNEFRSETCEKLKLIKGFNYFSAVKNSDLKTYLYDRFDYTFFPCVQNIVIKLVTPEFKEIKVFGSPDEKTSFAQNEDTFEVTRVPSMFPSDVTLSKAKENEIDSLGGLILVKFIPKVQEKLPQIDLKILLEYEDLQGNKFSNEYVIKENISAEEFYSNSATSKGVSLFYYAEGMINLLKAIEADPKLEGKEHYRDNMKKLLDYCPENKKEMVDKVIEMLQDKDKVPAEAH